MMPADGTARGGRGGAGFSKPHVSSGHHRHGSGHHRHGHRHFHSGTRFGFFFGGATLFPWYYAPAPYPVYPYPADYVEQDGYWYYCPAAQAYYPYVTQCPGAEWQRVEPTPPPPPG
jgi:hypothetical protein